MFSFKAFIFVIVKMFGIKIWLVRTPSTSFLPPFISPYVRLAGLTFSISFVLIAS